MNTQSNAMPESPLEFQGIAPAILSATRPLYWSIRRELWENRSIYIAPLAAAVVFLFGFLINMIALRRRIHLSWPINPTQHRDVLASPNEFAAALIMGTALIVGIFYSLDALYGERRDRSILFWKSLPISDLATVLSKLTIPVLVLPLLSFVITLITQMIMLVLSSAVLAGSGVNISTLWTQSSFIHVSVGFFYHIITVHGLWYAPIYGWLLLVSAWAPRAPFIWAFLPPFVICGVEKIAFNTSHFLTMLEYRLIGPPASASMAPGSAPMDPMAALMPHGFFSEPGLWIGLAVAVVFLAAAVRLRRYRGPI
jgi:ABC-2 type transport system permease protein